jgi:hypothetical protein
MKARHLLMIAGLAAAGWLAFFGDKSPSSKIAEPVVRDVKASKPALVSERTAQINSANSNKSMHSGEILALQDRVTLIGGSHKKSSGKGLFGRQNWTPPPPPPKFTPPPPPMAPAIPFTYIGKKFDGTSWEVYLMRGEQTFVVRDNTILDNNYHVDSIKPPILSLTYIPLNQVQTITIGGTD